MEQPLVEDEKIHSLLSRSESTPVPLDADSRKPRDEKKSQGGSGAVADPRVMNYRPEMSLLAGDHRVFSPNDALHVQLESTETEIFWFGFLNLW